MKKEQFDSIVEAQVMRSVRLLTKKEKEYAPGVDRLAAFKKAAALQNSSTTAAAFGMLTKHLVSVADMVDDPTAYSSELWDEKLCDSINYLLIIRALVTEAYNYADIAKAARSLCKPEALK